MMRAKPNRAAQQTFAGRLFSLVFVAVGIAALGFSCVAEHWVRADWFWSSEDRAAAKECQAHFDKLYSALVTENSRRARSGLPNLIEEPEALRIARSRLKSAKQPLRISQERPRQVAAVARYTGAGCLGLGLLTLWWSRRHATSPGPSASDDGASQ